MDMEMDVYLCVTICLFYDQYCPLSVYMYICPYQNSNKRIPKNDSALLI